MTNNNPRYDARGWEKIITGDNYKETGIYHVDGAEYNLDTEKLIGFIRKLLSSKADDPVLKESLIAVHERPWWMDEFDGMMRNTPIRATEIKEFIQKTVSEAVRIKISELREHIDCEINDHGNGDISIGLGIARGLLRREEIIITKDKSI